MTEKKIPSMGRARKGFMLFVGLVMLVQLACISVDMGVKIVPDGPESGRIEFLVAYRFTEKYIEEAKKANQEMERLQTRQQDPEMVQKAAKKLLEAEKQVQKTTRKAVKAAVKADNAEKDVAEQGLALEKSEKKQS